MDDETASIAKQLAELKTWVAAKFGFAPIESPAPPQKPQRWNSITRRFEDAAQPGGLQKVYWNNSAQQWQPVLPQSAPGPENMVRCKITRIEYWYVQNEGPGPRSLKREREAGSVSEVSGSPENYKANEAGELIIPKSSAEWHERVHFGPTVRNGVSSKYRVDWLEVYAPVAA